MVKKDSSEIKYRKADFAKSLFNESNGPGSVLGVDQEELEDHLNKTYSDPLHDVSLPSPGQYLKTCASWCSLRSVQLSISERNPRVWEENTR